MTHRALLMAKPLPRLVDLHSDWLLQYVPDTGGHPPDVVARAITAWPQGEGYLGAVSAAVLAVRGDDDSFANRPDPWRALADMLARVEAEFAGRLLLGPDDLARWKDDPNGLAWGVMAIDGFDGLIRSPADLDRLPGLFERGVRIFRPVRTAANLLGGSSESGDDRGLTDLGRGFLETLMAASRAEARPILDLSGLNAASFAEVLSWIEADGDRLDRLQVMSRRVDPPQSLHRFRAIGGMIGISVSPPDHDSTDAVRRAIEAVAQVPFRGRSGHEGIGLATGFLGLERTLPGLASAGEVIAWTMANFEEATALAILQGNAEAFLTRSVARRGGFS